MNNYNYYQNAYMGYPQANNVQPYYPRPSVQQPYVSTPQQPQAFMELPIVDIKFVSQKKDVEDFIVFPNTSVLLIDRSSATAYLKLANGNAQPFLRQFSFSELSQDGKPIIAPTSEEKPKDEQFVKKEDFDRLDLVSMAQYKEDINKLVESFNSKLKELKNKIGEFANGKQLTE